MKTTGNKAVDALIDYRPPSVAIPHMWFQTIVYKNGKPNMNAIIILAEIVYWYRPSVEKNETTGEFLGYKKRFKADLLQKNRSGFSKTFGLTKDQVYTALKTLEEMGIITNHLRQIDLMDTTLNNVRFIELHAEQLKGITYPVVQKRDPIVQEREPYRIETTPLSYRNETYTSTTGTETTSPQTTQSNPIVERSSTTHLDIIDYLNSKTGKKYKASTKSTRSLINARIKDGFTLDDFKKVIDNKIRDWAHDPKMSKFIRPETLFGTKFESYLNESHVVRTSATPDHSQYDPSFGKELPF